MKTTYRVPIVSAATIGLLFCATPAIADTPPEPTPAVSESPSASGYEDVNPGPDVSHGAESLESVETRNDEADATPPQTQDLGSSEPTPSVGMPDDAGISSFTTSDVDLFDESSGSEEAKIVEGLAVYDAEDLIEPLLEDGTSLLAAAEFWEGFDDLFPEGSEDWDDGQWDAFLQTPAGAAFLDDLDAYLAQLDALFPEGSETWDETQWEAFFETPEGEAFLKEFYAFLFPNLTDEEFAELLAVFEALFAEWLAILEEELLSENNQPSSSPVTATPETAPEAQPVAATTTSAPAEVALATTGTNSAGLLAGLGVVLFLLGAGVLVGQRRLQARRASTRD